jgi:hypothetical protein
MWHRQVQLLSHTGAAQHGLTGCLPIGATGARGWLRSRPRALFEAVGALLGRGCAYLHACGLVHRSQIAELIRRRAAAVRG